MQRYKFLDEIAIAGDFGAAADVEADDLQFDVSTATVAKAQTEPTLLQPRVVVYDGVCHLCHRGVTWLIGIDKDKKIKFCCLQSKAPEPYMRVCGVAERMFSVAFCLLKVQAFTAKAQRFFCRFSEDHDLLAATLLCTKCSPGYPDSSQGHCLQPYCQATI